MDIIDIILSKALSGGSSGGGSAISRFTLETSLTAGEESELSENDSERLEALHNSGELVTTLVTVNETVGDTRSQCIGFPIRFASFSGESDISMQDIYSLSVNGGEHAVLLVRVGLGDSGDSAIWLATAVNNGTDTT